MDHGRASHLGCHTQGKRENSRCSADRRLIRNPDERLQALADELNERYGGSWLMPVFMKAIITQPKEQVYETYSPLLDTPQKGYLFHALGMLHYRCYPEAGPMNAWARME